MRSRLVVRGYALFFFDKAGPIAGDLNEQDSGRSLPSFTGTAGRFSEMERGGQNDAESRRLSCRRNPTVGLKVMAAQVYP